MSLFKPSHFLVLLVASLSACGGGGGGGGSGGTPAVTSFSEIKVTDSAWTWTTNQTASAATVTVTRSSGVVGVVLLVIANFTDTDPSDSSVKLAVAQALSPIATVNLGLPPIDPATGLVVGYPSNPSAAPAWTTLAADFGNLTLPAATTKVLVQVIDIANPANGVLVQQVVNVSDLFGSKVALSI